MATAMATVMAMMCGGLLARAVYATPPAYIKTAYRYTSTALQRVYFVSQDTKDNRKLRIL